MRIPDAFGKVTTSGIDNNGKVVSETIGYTDINVFDGNQSALVETLYRFAKATQTSLTNNTYQDSSISYEVKLDTLAD